MLNLLYHIAWSAVKVVSFFLMAGAFSSMLKSKLDKSASHEDKMESMLCDMALMIVMGMILCA